MEHTLRCNSLKCRKELDDKAVVTTCSHIFCIDCSNQLQLSGHREGRRPICPACDAQLLNPDDVVVTCLNPTEDYKTSVLSGLNPNVIMECAGRALSFWAYQTTQEIVYQEYLAKSLTNKYAALNTQLDKIIHDANGEISNLRNRMTNMQTDQDSFRRKNEELVQALREKTRKHLQTQELYDKLKRRAMLGQIQNAALDAVDHTIQASVTANRFDDRIGNQNQRPAPPPLFSEQQNAGMQQPGVAPAGSMNIGLTPLRNHGNGGSSWAGFCGQGSIQNQPIQTPSTHRQRLASGNVSASQVGPPGHQSNGAARTPMQQQRASPRQPLAPMTGNVSTSGLSGYGLTAGLKVSNLAGSVINGMARPGNRLRVAQRPASGFTGQSVPNFGPGTPTNMFSNGESYY